MRATAGMAETKLVMASSAGPHSISGQAHEAVDAVLTKPVREQSLLDAFGRLFGGSSPAPAAPSPVSAVPSPPAAPAKPTVRPLRILLAEDNKINQMVVTAVLRNSGHQIEIAENGEQAVAAGNGPRFRVG